MRKAEMCPLCPHLLGDHEDGKPCSARPVATHMEPIEGHVWCLFTNRCLHRDRNQQPYPWPVAVPEELFV